MVLISISLRIRDVEHFFFCVLAICVSSFEKCLLKSLKRFFIFCYWIPYIFWVVTSEKQFATRRLLFCRCLLAVVSFALQKLPRLIGQFCVPCASGVSLKKTSVQTNVLQSVSLVFLLVVSGFWSYILNLGSILS